MGQKQSAEDTEEVFKKRSQVVEEFVETEQVTLATHYYSLTYIPPFFSDLRQ